MTPVDERSFAIIFFDKELLEFAAPYEQHREVWGLRTSYGPQPIPEIVSASTRPQLALMIVLALAMALGVFLVAGAAAREVRVAELKSNFVASVSHDLKTPLALIQLFAETLELGRVRTPERAQEYYRIINGESKKLTRLIENILDFSRMEAGLRPYRMEPADLSESVSKVLTRMRCAILILRFRGDSILQGFLASTVPAQERRLPRPKSGAASHAAIFQAPACAGASDVHQEKSPRRRRFEGPAGARTGVPPRMVRLNRRTAATHHEEHHEKDQADDEQDPRDVDRRAGDSREPEHRRDQRDDEKRNGP